MGGGDGGGWEAKGELGHSLELKEQCYPVAQTGTIHRVGQDGHYKQPGTPWSPINAPQGYQ